MKNSELSRNSNDNLISSIKEKLNTSDFASAIENLVKKITIDETNFSKEIEDLTKEVSSLKSKLNILEQTNKSLVREKNFNLVREYSADLVEALEEDDLYSFKKIIEDHDYPINDFIYEAYEDLSHMNLLHYAIDINRKNFIEFLLEKEADVNVPDKLDHWTPIMYAIQKQNIKLIRKLLDKGASVDYKDIDGFTPLAVAVDSNNEQIIQLILNAKPEVDLKF